VTSASPPPSTYPGAGFPPPAWPVAPPKRSNGFGTAAFVCGIFALVPLGLIFGILGLVRARKVGGIGRSLSWAGVVLSVLWTIGLTTAVIVSAPSLVKATNPGCIAAENALAQSTTRVNAATDRAAFMTELQTEIRELNDAATKSTNAEATAAMATMVKDIQELLDDIQKGQVPGSDLQARLTADGNGLDRACGRT
jgi:hypothetical protein